MTVLKVFLFVALLVVALVFAYYNMEEVRVSFLWYSVSMPLFLTVIVSFCVGFVLAYLGSELRYFSLKRYRDKVRKALTYLWMGYPKRAEGLLKGLMSSEDMVPLYILSRREQGKDPGLDPTKFKEGVAETYMAEELFRKDFGEAKELLEKALGKNWNNLRARRMLRSIYFIEGDHQKAVDLQREIVKETEPPMRGEEEKVLASMLAEAFGEKALEEVERLPKTLSSLALTISVSEEEKGAKVFQKALDQGIGSELLALLWEKKSLSPRILDTVKERTDSFDPDLLALIYADMGMVERLEGLKDKVSTPIKFFTDRESCREIRGFIKLWACEACGMEYVAYTPVCVWCLSWNRLKIKGGRSYAHRLLQRDSEV